MCRIPTVSNPIYPFRLSGVNRYQALVFHWLSVSRIDRVAAARFVCLYPVFVQSARADINRLFSAVTYRGERRQIAPIVCIGLAEDERSD